MDSTNSYRPSCTVEQSMTESDWSFKRANDDCYRYYCGTSWLHMTPLATQMPACSKFGTTETGLTIKRLQPERMLTESVWLYQVIKHLLVISRSVTRNQWNVHGKQTIRVIRTHRWRTMGTVRFEKKNPVKSILTETVFVWQGEIETIHVEKN